MQRTRWSISLLVAAVLFLSMGGGSTGAQRTGKTTLGEGAAGRQMLSERLASFGHRNWIVIADSAYPAQTSPGIETVVTGAEQLDVLKVVLDELKAVKHVRPTIYLDAELPVVAEADAPGIEKYRVQLGRLLAGRERHPLPHDQIIEKLDAAGQKFKVLILKTDLTLPYTSVFLELDCGYWSKEAEQRLREAMKAKAK